MMLVARAEGEEIVAVDIARHEEHGMRIAHGGRGKALQRGVGFEGFGERDMRRVAGRAGERNLFPCEFRRSHIHRNPAVFEPVGDKRACNRAEVEMAAPVSGKQIVGDAARSVAAGLGHRSVGVQDVDPAVGGILARIVERHDLVEGGVGMGVEADGGLRGDLVGPPAHVDHQDLVAKPVHAHQRRPVFAVVHARHSCQSCGLIWAYRRAVTSLAGEARKNPPTEPHGPSPAFAKAVFRD